MKKKIVSVQMGRREYHFLTEKVKPLKKVVAPLKKVMATLKKIMPLLEKVVIPIE